MDLSYLFNRCYIILVVFYLSIVRCSTSDENVNLPLPKIQKCCGPDEALSNSFVCESLKITRFNTSDLSTNSTSNDSSENYFKGSLIMNYSPWWSHDYMFLSAKDSKTISFNPVNFSETFDIHHGKIPCHLKNSAHLKMFEFSSSWYIFDNGSILMTQNGRPRTFSSDRYCVDNVIINERVFVGAFICACDYYTCFRKCCFDDLILTKDQGPYTCVRHDNISWKPYFWKLEEGGDTVHEISKLPTCNPDGEFSTVNLNESEDVSMDFNILKDGSLEYNGVNYPKDTFCGDMTLFKSGKVIPNILTCRKKDLDAPLNDFHDPLYDIYAGIYFLGAIFLFCTILVYAVFSDLRKKAHAYNMIAHVSCLLVGYVTHCFLNLGTDLVKETIFCRLLGMILQVSFISSFLWMNVMCIDISLAFSQLRPLRAIKEKSEMRKFVYYSLYVWSATGLIVAITLVAEYTQIFPSIYRPHFGENYCWFAGLVPTGLYYYLPVSILCIVNILLFVSTSIKISVAHNDVQQTLPSDPLHEGRRTMRKRNRFIIYVKLFCLMGLLWILEVVDVFFIDFKPFSIIIDTANLLRAVFIFIIFCWNDTVIKLIKKKIGSNNHNARQNSPNGSNNNSSSNYQTCNRTNSIQLSRVSSVCQSIGEKSSI